MFLAGLPAADVDADMTKVRDQFNHLKGLTGQEAQEGFEKSRDGLKTLRKVPNWDWALKGVAWIMTKQVLDEYDKRKKIEQAAANVAAIPKSKK